MRDRFVRHPFKKVAGRFYCHVCGEMEPSAVHLPLNEDDLGEAIAWWKGGESASSFSESGLRCFINALIAQVNEIPEAKRQAEPKPAMPSEAVSYADSVMDDLGIMMGTVLDRPPINNLKLANLLRDAFTAGKCATAMPTQKAADHEELFPDFWAGFGERMVEAGDSVEVIARTAWHAAKAGMEKR